MIVHTDPLQLKGLEDALARISVASADSLSDAEFNALIYSNIILNAIRHNNLVVDRKDVTLEVQNLTIETKPLVCVEQLAKDLKKDKE